ncbi:MULTISPECIES: ribosome hibernation-promoting factor, HPF/YfiA family [Micrococcaceae]|uniref:Ribosome hibernation promoting factor n=1 Tax=Arthrobacter rhombi TaxID=71253 RepID=A0A1R4GN68_9MICC|nr:MULTISPECIES: ribosome-associated translation inhibitor RaiA [Micrococcaceae]PCC25001.1 ribosomal subunit interface protein [Glutamicibacter sp. BW78]SJM69322.1 Ribosomal subunit interface protein [Arthrobacter rhombi]
MEMNITGRNVTVSDRFREYADEKTDKIEQLASKVQRLDVKVTKEPNARQAEAQLTVEISVVGSGPAIRAEAKAADKFAAFDTAFAKLLERLRRARDRRKVHHGRQTPKAVFQATSTLEPVSSTMPLHEQTRQEQDQEREAAEAAAESPVEIRRKVFPSETMSVDDAVDRMELVGHPFYLFVDAETGVSSVVYRRRQWNYGVITLDDNHSDEETVETRKYRGSQGAAV